MFNIFQRLSKRQNIPEVMISEHGKTFSYQPDKIYSM